MKAEFLKNKHPYRVAIWLGDTKEDVYGATLEEAKNLYKTLGEVLHQIEEEETYGYKNYNQR